MEKVNTNKKQYNKPMLISEEFVPQEYVAVCFYIQCAHTDYDYAGTLENLRGHEDLDNDGIKGNHNTGGCITFGQTAINVGDNGNYTIFEHANNLTWKGGDATILSGAKTEDGYYIDEEGSITLGDLQSGKTIVWKTTGSGWECIHVGAAVMTGSNPSHS